MRMCIRRFTRLTNGFSRRFENRWAAIAVSLAFCNFCRFHQFLRTTPTLADGITDLAWEFPSY